MKIITYNVNGIRAAMKKDWVKWLKATKADVLCIQETKAQEDQVNVDEIRKLGYNTYFYSAQKKGYSGVAIFSKTEPDHVEFGMGIKKYDDEGRVIRADFGELSIMSVYMPSGSSGDERQAFKMKWLKDFYKYANKLRESRKKLIICGDYNICHKAIDIHNPVSNKNSSGFLPEERAWMDKFTKSGFIDTFRYFNEEPHKYTWWSYRSGARKKNLGWRIDYCMATKELESDLKRADILSEAVHSDHCPALLEISK
ncbi:MAG: exodeoxyribonuclease III [Flavobacteriales bacterium]|nr:exodeoxyribonuclease III [Flavobacteriales bacterium]